MDGVLVNLELVRLGLQVAMLGLALAFFLRSPQMLTGIRDLFGAAGTRRPDGPARPRPALIMSVLILLALLFVINPELRLLLILTDAIGFDVVILLLALQFRGWLDVLYALLIRAMPGVLRRVRKRRVSETSPHES